MEPITPSRVGITDDPTDVVPDERGSADALEDATTQEACLASPVRKLMEETLAESQPPRPAESRAEELLPAGTVVGDYRIERAIGRGGMGIVYAAVHPVIGKRAAIKVLRAELCRSAFNVERFIDEARVVNQIGHPHIVDVFAIGKTADGRSYLVMEWLKGHTLRERLLQSRADLDEILEIIRPLVLALEAAHDHGVIHRDLKPDNVFLVEMRGGPPLVKLLDFGIAKLAEHQYRLDRTETGAMVGTPQYMAPEQVKSSNIDHRADIYALGCLWFELLTGSPPFQAATSVEMVARHLREPPRRPSTLAEGIPPELDDLVFRMLAKQPAERPTLAEVHAAIDRAKALERTNVLVVEPPAVQPRPVAATPPPDAPRMLPAPPPAPVAPAPAIARSRKRRRLGLGFWIASIAIFAASMAGAFYLASSLRGSP